ncbi:MAG TPA: hypothetical protein VJ785_01925 [Anaerolineales bacterium]|nr:hypothetical protein [Anaerolineales bacterium]
MNFGAIIEVAVGIIFVWIVLSLSTIQIQEWISTRLDRRAKDLEESIHEMLANENLKAQFYDHPVIRGLTAKKRKQPSRTPAWFNNHPLVRGFTKEKRKIPSYIPSQQFALTLFDIALTAGTESSLIQQGILKIRNDIEKDKNASADEAVIVELNLLAELARSAAATEAGTAITQKTLAKLKDEADNFIENYPQYAGLMEAALEEAARLKDEIDIVLKNQPRKDLRSSLGKLRRGIAALSVISPEVNQTLNALLMNVEDYAAGAESELAKARGNVEKWFDDSMDRISGAFKRYSQMMALIIGFVVALVLNVDSIDLTLYLWAEPAVRTALAQNAEAFELSQEEIEANPEQAMQNFRNQFAGLALPVGWGITNFQVASTSNPECQLFPGENETFGIPIVFTTRCIVPPQPTNEMNIFLKLGGIFITALAARQGAPFWFDILKKAVNLRGTGVNPVEKGK